MRQKRRKDFGKEKKVGLARALSKMGFCSRSEAVELIRAGRVKLKRRGEEKMRKHRCVWDGMRFRWMGKNAKAAEESLLHVEQAASDC